MFSSFWHSPIFFLSFFARRLKMAQRWKFMGEDARMLWPGLADGIYPVASVFKMYMFYPNLAPMMATHTSVQYKYD
jgi:hypothetical protein